MNRGTLSEPVSAKDSPVPGFFISNMHGEAGSWGAYFNFLKSTGKGTELEELAQSKSWRSKQKYQYKKVVEEGKHKNIPLSYGLCKSINEAQRKQMKDHRLRESMTAWWFIFERHTSEIREKYPDSPITHLFLFVAGLKYRKFDTEEMLMWMLCAYLEWISLDLMVVRQIDNNNRCDSFFVPIHCWIPRSDGDSLRTTRNTVLSELFEKYDDRNFRHLIGRANGYDKGTLSRHRKLSVNHTMIELRQHSDIVPPVLIEIQYRMLFSFVSFFEEMQLDMLSNNIPVRVIEASFSRLPKIASTFEDELYKYFIENNV